MPVDLREVGEDDADDQRGFDALAEGDDECLKHTAVTCLRGRSAEVREESAEVWREVAYMGKSNADQSGRQCDGHRGAVFGRVT